MKQGFKSGYILLIFLFVSCRHKTVPNQEMVDLLHQVNQYEANPLNSFSPESTLKYADSVIHKGYNNADIYNAQYNKATALLQLGQEQNAINVLLPLLTKKPNYLSSTVVEKQLALAYLRLGERMNCINHHGAESCTYPISMGGMHMDSRGSAKAIEVYTRLLRENPKDYESMWLMNIAYMTIGGYPQQVPPQFLIKVNEDTLHAVRPFKDVAVNAGLNVKSEAGGSIVDDFNNDGYPDIVTSSWDLKEPMHYFQNNKNGTFSDLSLASGLGYLTGGLNMMQTDYNNDGFKDIFVLRGAWKGKFGKEPSSLLRNNGDGTFTDVTKESGLLALHPTQTATWADFNNDGWLDVFIGNETKPGDDVYPCLLYINNHNGSFTEAAVKANCAVKAFVKGVTSGDYDNDGRADIFISTMNGKAVLLKNETVKGGPVKFTDQTEQAGLGKQGPGTFATWFWDYDNDGWLDILVCGYGVTESFADAAAKEALNLPTTNAGKVFLYRNKHDGTFENVSAAVGLNKVAFAMGANFGDIDNDGYLDFYLGTGNPLFTSLVPNKLFRNIGGKSFADVTISGRVGNLQKGHGVSFADLNNDGHTDIFIKMGGAFTGDAYENSLYLNPGQNNNHWINILLEGTNSNNAAIGAKIKTTFIENGIERSVYRDVNSGGSFGSNPLQQHIGIGKAVVIKQIEIKWPSGKIQSFNNVAANINVKLKESDRSYTTYQLTRLNFNVKPI
ncbi:MAG: hypothetical protein JWR67_256 [Mucilaginibacter sp.]|nr:hypothetical protein [Mucilaginibacter sp.]